MNFPLGRKTEPFTEQVTLGLTLDKTIVSSFDSKKPLEDGHRLPGTQRIGEINSGNRGGLQVSADGVRCGVANAVEEVSVESIEKRFQMNRSTHARQTQVSRVTACVDLALQGEDDTT